MAYTAAMFESKGRMRKGEKPLCACLACDRDQAKIVLGFVRALFSDVPMLSEMLVRETAIGFELSNGVEIAVGTNSYRAVRGRPILIACLDEVAFYRDENSSSPDEEVYRALVPGTATLSESMLIGISSPYRKSGLLYRKFSEHFGKDVDDILVIRGPTRRLNPTIDD